MHTVLLIGLRPVLYLFWCWLLLFLHVLHGFSLWDFRSVSSLCSILGCLVLLCAWHTWLHIAKPCHRLWLHLGIPYTPFFFWFPLSLSVGWVRDQWLRCFSYLLLSFHSFLPLFWFSFMILSNTLPTRGFLSFLRFLISSFSFLIFLLQSWFSIFLLCVWVVALPCSRICRNHIFGVCWFDSYCGWRFPILFC